MVTSKRMSRRGALHNLSLMMMLMRMMMMMRRRGRRISVMLTSRRMGRRGALVHNLSQNDWPCFPNDALPLSILLQIIMMVVSSLHFFACIEEKEF